MIPRCFYDNTTLIKYYVYDSNRCTSTGFLPWFDTGHLSISLTTPSESPLYVSLAGIANYNAQLPGLSYSLSQMYTVYPHTSNSYVSIHLVWFCCISLTGHVYILPKSYQGHLCFQSNPEQDESSPDFQSNSQLPLLKSGKPQIPTHSS